MKSSSNNTPSPQEQEEARTKWDNGDLDVTMEELLEVLRQQFLTEESDDFSTGATRAELEEKLGWGPSKTLYYIKSAIAKGFMEPVYIKRRNMHGDSTHVKGYVLTKR